jgi:predicted dehydrogenase
VRSKPHIGIVGCGYWGYNLVRVFAEQSDAKLVRCSDLKPNVLAKITERYPWVKVSTRFQSVIEDPDIDAVCVCTPASTHYDVTMMALKNGKDVLVEKPLALSSNHVNEMIQLARKNKRILMVGHVYMFHPAVKMLRELVKSGHLGRIYYASSVRTGFGPVRSDVNSLWDLAPHDISLLSYVLQENPMTVVASGASYLQKGIEDVVFLTMKFGSGVTANVHVSWLDPSKRRVTAIVGSKRMAVFDDVELWEKIRIYDKSVNRKYLHPDYADFQLSLRDGDIRIPRLSSDEPLKLECNHFVECVRDRKQAVTGGEDGLMVVNVLEAAQRALRNGFEEHIKA